MLKLGSFPLKIFCRFATFPFIEIDLNNGYYYNVIYSILRCKYILFWLTGVYTLVPRQIIIFPSFPPCLYCNQKAKPNSRVAPSCGELWQQREERREHHRTTQSINRIALPAVNVSQFSSDPSKPTNYHFDCLEKRKYGR